MAYESLATLKADISKSDNDDDATLSLFLDAATRAIDRFCNRPTGFVASSEATVKYYLGSGANWMRVDEFVEVTAVAVKDAITGATFTSWTAPSSNFAGDGDWIPFSGDIEQPDFNTLPFDALMVDPNGDQSLFTGPRSVQDLYFNPADIPHSPRRGTSSSVLRPPTVQVTARWGYAEEVPDDIRKACGMQSAIWYKRMEGSMASVLANPELGTLEVFRTLDPAIEQILVLGRYVRPSTGRM